MSTSNSQADDKLIEQLVLGQLPLAEAERLAVQLADDSRVAMVAEAASDTLVNSLRNHETTDDSQSAALVERMVQRLKPLADPPEQFGETVGVESDGSHSHEPIPEQLEYFRIIKVLGQGGMGTVYLADDTRLGRQVALKTLKRELAANPAAKDRFLREARSAARLHHDHIIPIYYVGEADGTPFLAMPYLEGEPLDARIKRQLPADPTTSYYFEKLSGEAKPLPIPEAVRIAREVALGLSVAHKQGLIHRDIKPANIWLESSGEPGEPATGISRVKILDFGLARSQHEAAHLTASGAIIGTPAYMAPEQARGKQVDARADLFSLGCVLFEMLTGKRPFKGSDTMATLTSLALDTPPDPDTLNPSCPRELSQLTMQLLAKQPEQRPASAEIVAKRLAKLETPIVTPLDSATAADPWSQIDDADQTEDIPEAKVVGTLRVPTQNPRKRRVLPFAAIALLLAFIGVGVVFGGTVIRVANNEGELVVTVDDPNTEVAIKGEGVEIRRLESDGKKRAFLVKAGKDGEVEVREQGSETVLMMEKFKVTRGGKVEVLVTVDKLAPGWRNIECDRRAARYALSIGGKVRIQEKGKEGNPTTVAELPRGLFELRIVDLSQNAKITDEGLGALRDCKELTHLFLQSTEVGDAGMRQIKSCTNLTLLNLKKTKVTAQGIDELRKALPNCKIEWDGVNVSPDPNSERAAAELFQPHADWLRLQLPNAQLVAISSKDKLPAGPFTVRGVQFDATEHPSSYGPKVVTAVVKLRGLEELNGWIWRTPLSSEELTRLADAPVAQSLRDIGFHFELTAETIKTLKRFPVLETVAFSGSLVDDAQLAHLRDLPPGVTKLLLLDLGQQAQYGDAGIAAITSRPLTSLRIEGGGKGVARQLTRAVAGMPGLTYLSCGGCGITDDHLIDLAKSPSLEQLTFYGNGITDAGLTHLKGMKRLRQVWLPVNPVTEAGVKALAAARPDLRIVWDGGVIEPSSVPPGEWVQLFNGKDLTGWEGLEGSWRWQDGALIGAHQPADPAARSPHTNLCSVKKYKDFELKFQVRLKDGKGNSGVQFRSEVSDRKTFEVRGPQADVGLPDYWGGLYDQGGIGVMMAPPAPVVAKTLKPNDFNDYYIKCVGKHVTIRLNGETTVDADFPTLPADGVIAWQLARNDGPVEVTFKNIEIKELTQGEFQPIFNGKDLTGWSVASGGVGEWKVVDGALTSSGQTSYLLTERGTFGDFHLRVEAKINGGGNSGIFFRTSKPLVEGVDYEAQLTNLASQQFKTGALWGIGEKKASPVAPDTWFTYEIIAEGNRIRLLVNGKETADYSETRPRRRLKGHIALQHWDADTQVHFRKIEIREGKELGAVAPGADPDRRAAEWVLDIGGQVQVSLPETLIRTKAELPAGPWGHLNLALNGNQKVKDEDLARFKNVKPRLRLGLSDTNITDAGLEHLRGLNIGGITLRNTRVTDKGLEALATLTDPDVLALSKTEVSDKGLLLLKVKSPFDLYVEECPKVTAAGVKAVVAALPNCNISSDHGKFGPKYASISERKAAEWVLSIGGTVRTSEDGPEIKTTSALPTDPFRVVFVDLKNNIKASDSGLANLKDCRNLTTLDLRNTQVTDSGMVHFKNCTELKSLYLAGTKVGDAGLVHFKECKKLQALVLSGRQVGDPGLAQFKDCKTLTALDLKDTVVSSAGLAYFSPDYSPQIEANGLHCRLKA